MNAIKKLIEKSLKTPALAPVYALELDRLLLSMGQTPLTFSANGVAGATASIAKTLGLSQLYEAQSGTSAHASGNLYHAEKLVKEGKHSEAIAHAFANALGPEVNALNLLYANHATTNPKLRLHFLNKYLAAYGQEIKLDGGEGKNFFYQIKSTQTLEKVDGPLVTVIMPAHNAQDTIEVAVGSLLNQTWQNLQIIVVDDASTDGTLQKAKDLAKSDPRVEVLSSPVNVGPYVCRNLGMAYTRGQWLTVHYADHWAFPDRIEQQVQALTDANASACTGCMLSMNEQGQITRPVAGVSTSEDGYLRLSFVSLMVQTAYFNNELGAWDSVCVGGDAELIERLKVLGTPKKHLRRPLMLCLDQEAGLTNHQAFGLSDETGQTRPLRADYSRAFTAWHKAPGSKKISPFGKARPFEIPEKNMVDPGAIKKVFVGSNQNLELPEGTAEKRSILRSASQKKINKATSSGRNVLWQAYQLARVEGLDAAIRFAEQHAEEAERHTLHILKANRDLDNDAAWLEHTNAYLEHYGTTPVALEPGDAPRFYRLVPSIEQKKVETGPLISVIMPAYNAEKTLDKAARSILQQTWKPLELIIVDDASSDSTYEIALQLAQDDMRVRVLRNPVNAGPYVAKNRALQIAQGSYISGHDADDWAHPERLAKQVYELLHTPGGPLAVFSYMLRMDERGCFSRIKKISSLSPDGVATKSYISGMFDAGFLRDRLGYWDTVRSGADGELIARAKLLEPDRLVAIQHLGMLCLDLETSLTSHPINGISSEGVLSPSRKSYMRSFQQWHQGLLPKDALLDFPHHPRKFSAPNEFRLEKDVLARLFLDPLVLNKKSDYLIDQFCKTKIEIFEFLRFVRFSKEIPSSSQLLKLYRALDPRDLGTLMMSDYRNAGGGVSFSQQINRLILLKSELSEIGVQNLAPSSNLKDRDHSFAKNFGVPVPKHYGLFDSWREIPLIPNTIVKPYVGSSSNGVFFVNEEKHIHSVKNGVCYFSLEEAIVSEDIEKNINVSFDKWIVEQAVIGQGGGIAPNLKVFSFYGECAMFLEVLFPTAMSEKTRKSACDSAGRRLKLAFEGEEEAVPVIPDEARRYCECISLESPVPFLRIDFLKGHDGLYLGEITPHPGPIYRGGDLTPELDQELGRAYLRAEARLYRDLLNGKQFDTYRQVYGATW